MRGAFVYCSGTPFVSGGGLSQEGATRQRPSRIFIPPKRNFKVEARFWPGVYVCNYMAPCQNAHSALLFLVLDYFWRRGGEGRALPNKHSRDQSDMRVYGQDVAAALRQRRGLVNETSVFAVFETDRTTLFALVHL